MGGQLQGLRRKFEAPDKVALIHTGVGSEQSDITPNVHETPAAGDPLNHYQSLHTPYSL